MDSFWYLIKLRLTSFKTHNTILKEQTQSYSSWLLMAIPTSPTMGMYHMALFTATQRILRKGVKC